jgi:transposase-like protein
MKLTLEDKKKIIELYKDGNGYKSIAKKFNIHFTSIKKIINGYSYHGEKYLLHQSKNNYYSPEIKEQIIKRVYQGESRSQLAAQYGIPGGAGTIVSWIHKYEQFGYNGFITKKRGRPKMKKEVKKHDEESLDESIDLSNPLADKERKEFERLKKEYKKLKKEKDLTDMENEFLKKLDALVQERLKREGKN